MDIQAVQEDRQGKVPYEYIRNIFKDCNPKKMSELSGTVYDARENHFIIKLMGRDYIVKYPSGQVFIKDSGVEIEAYAVKTVFLRYLANAKGVPLTGKNITYKEIPGGHVYYHNFYTRTILKLAKIYGNNLEEFIVAGKEIGAEETKVGDAGYRFQFLNNVYLTFIVWEADEEFSPSANILFDLNTSYYFDAEDLAVVGELALAIFKRHGELPDWKGLYQRKAKKA